MLTLKALLSAALVASMTGCALQQAAPPTSTPVPTTLAATATPDVGFAAAVTGVPVTATPSRARITPTRFVPPHGPYLELVPNVGPPVSRVITVHAGHLPPNSAVNLSWSRTAKSSTVSTTVTSDADGRVDTQFAIPGSPPATYHIVASVEGRVYASVPYIVRSVATLAVGVIGNRKGETMSVVGRHFVKSTRLLLVAYPIDVRGKPIVVSTVQSDAKGAFVFHGTVRGLHMGQYVLRAWSESTLTALMAETFFQVVI